MTTLRLRCGCPSSSVTQDARNALMGFKAGEPKKALMERLIHEKKKDQRSELSLVLTRSVNVLPGTSKERSREDETWL